jgi:hypothetical protein
MIGMLELLAVIGAMSLVFAILCAFADRHIDADPPMSRRKEKALARMMSEEYRNGR